MVIFVSFKFIRFNLAFKMIRIFILHAYCVNREMYLIGKSERNHILISVC